MKELEPEIIASIGVSTNNGRDEFTVTLPLMTPTDLIMDHALEKARDEMYKIGERRLLSFLGWRVKQVPGYHRRELHPHEPLGLDCF